MIRSFIVYKICRDVNCSINFVSVYSTFANILFPDRPETPTLTANDSSPTDGDAILLTCTTNTAGITSYEFRFGDSILNTSASNTYAIDSATIDSHDGNYTCIAFIDIVPSNISSVLRVECEYPAHYFNCFVDF